MSAAVEDDVHMISWKGNNKRILVYPVDYDQQFNVTCTYPSDLSNKQTSNDSSATAVGKRISALPPLVYLKLTLWLGSIQSKNLF